MKFHVEIEREIDGCWIAEVPKISGMFAGGADVMRLSTRVRQLPCAGWLNAQEVATTNPCLKRSNAQRKKETQNDAMAASFCPPIRRASLGLDVPVTFAHLKLANTHYA